jgi:hypothetical protein
MKPDPVPHRSEVLRRVRIILGDPPPPAWQFTQILWVLALILWALALVLVAMACRGSGPTPMTARTIHVNRHHAACQDAETAGTEAQPLRREWRPRR